MKCDCHRHLAVAICDNMLLPPTVELLMKCNCYCYFSVAVSDNFQPVEELLLIKLFKKKTKTEKTNPLNQKTTKKYIYTSRPKPTAEKLRKKKKNSTKEYLFI